MGPEFFSTGPPASTSILGVGEHVSQQGAAGGPSPSPRPPPYLPAPTRQPLMASAEASLADDSSVLPKAALSGRSWC